MLAPKSIKILVIMHLCFAFMVLAWYASYPFMGELYHFRSRLFLAQTVQGKPELLNYVSDEDAEISRIKLEFNAMLFNKLPGYQQDEIIDDAIHYQRKLQTSWKEKLESVIAIFLRHLPLFKKTWLIFSFLICFSLLYRVQGALVSVWLLPLLSLCYLLDNHFLALPTAPPDASLFPTEKEIMADALSFKEGWQKYLLNHWGQEAQGQKESRLMEAEFRFNQARLAALRRDPSYKNAYQFKGREPLPILLLYFAWNLFLAYKVYKRGTYEFPSQQHSLDSPDHSVGQSWAG